MQDIVAKGALIMKARALQRAGMALVVMGLLALAGCGNSSGGGSGTQYKTFVSPKYEYSIQIPTQLHLVESSPSGQPSTNQTNNTNGEYPVFRAPASKGSSGMQVTLTAAGSGFDRVTFCSAGAPIKVDGIPARQIEHLQPAPTALPNQPSPVQPGAGTQAGLASISAQLISGNVYYIIQLSAPGSGQSFLQHYNPIWQHMLSSFRAGKSLGNSFGTC
jgi:hypothetical protein